MPPLVLAETPFMFGHSIAGGVDLVEGAEPEFLIGCPFYSIDGSEQGGVYAYTVNPVTKVISDAFLGLQPVTLPTVTIPPQSGPFLEDFANFGWSVASLGQYDPVDDPGGPREFVVGALRIENAPPAPSQDPCPGIGQGGRQSGRAFVLRVTPGQPASVDVQCLYKGEDATRMRLGTSVASGDFDGDGLLDVAAGGSGYGVAGEEFGRVYLFSNTTTPPGGQ